MGHILAGFLSGYKKELPADVEPSSQEERPFELWAEYLDRLIHPDHHLTPRQISMIRYQAKTVADALLEKLRSRRCPAIFPAALPSLSEGSLRRGGGLCSAGHGF